MTPAAIADFVARRFDLPAGRLRVTVTPIPGGLESSVVRARIASSDHRVPHRLVVKQLRGVHRREAAVYAAVETGMANPPLAHVLGLELQEDAACLYLEDVEVSRAWPWADITVAAEVCRVLAALHRSGVRPDSVDDWNYEQALVESAQTTMALARVTAEAGGTRAWRRRGDLARVVDALPSIRGRLAHAGFVVIHGDVHPGNVIVRHNGGGLNVRLIDWARARPGSPLEDVASWLHSLGCWEPEARRRHDTLLVAYLQAFAPGCRLTAETRTLYWLAAASNGLSGAIRYHLSVAGDPRSTEGERASSRHATQSWERVIRRAASLLREVR